MSFSSRWQGQEVGKSCSIAIVRDPLGLDPLPGLVPETLVFPGYGEWNTSSLSAEL
jgi:hypothetical protein